MIKDDGDGDGDDDEDVVASPSRPSRVGIFVLYGLFLYWFGLSNPSSSFGVPVPVSNIARCLAAV